AVIFRKYTIPLLQALPVTLLGHPSDKILSDVTMSINNVPCLLCGADNPVDVSAKLVLCIVGFCKFAPHVDGLVADIHAVFKGLPRKHFGGFMPPVAENIPLLVYQFCFSVIDVSVVVAAKYFFQGGAFIEFITGVQKQDVISGCKPEAFVHGVVDSVIFFRDKNVYMRSVLFDDIEGAVCG